jgi:putative hydrolase of HD superfamily
MASDRLRQQIAFVTEADRLKSVLRRTSLVDRSRLENSAEHSWHLALMAMVFAEDAPPGTDMLRVLRMLIVHDLVEVDAGDTFAYDLAGYADKATREQAAADRMFALLPPDQASDVRHLWEEFEAGLTPTARFAGALDRFGGLLQNWAGGDGGTWRQHHVSRSAVMARMAPLEAAPRLWAVILEVVEAATVAGHVREG